MKIRGFAKQALKATFDVVFPRHCVHCHAPVEPPSPYDFLCAHCARELFLARPPACNICGHPFFGMLAGPKRCPHCEELDPAFDEGKTLFLAKGPGRSLLHELKYRAGFYVLNDIRTMVLASPHYRRFLAGARIIPVPLHPVKERERGFNQSDKIAALLASCIPGAQVEHLLSRQVFTRTQTQLNRADRDKNVKNAFAMAPDSVVIRECQYILVDDVFTTGSTLNACAGVLGEAGALHLKVATLGHG
ncbi:MAG: double zinc ribbon domain-containing protein [Opitutales bacterium]